MDKSKLTGNLAELYYQRATRRTNLRGNGKYVEYIAPRGRGNGYNVYALGINCYGQPVWGCADKEGFFNWYCAAVMRSTAERIYNNPKSIYDL